MQLCGFAGNGKAKAHMAGGRVARGVTGIKGLCAKAQRLGGKAGALVQHAQAQKVAAALGLQAYKAALR